jgi:membrane-bound lytic murein transglycosylase A
LTTQPHLVALDAQACRALLHDDAPAASLQQAAARSVESLQRLPQDRVLPALDHEVRVGEVVSILAAVADMTTKGDGWGEQVCDRFHVYRAELPQPMLVTGYYQPELTASRRRTERFRYPLYRTPDDLVDVDLSQFCPDCRSRVGQGRVENGKVVPYYSRAEIEAGALVDRGYEIAWLDDPVEVYFLHVQGSAVLRFDDGVHMQVSYGGSNGRPYTSIGSVLIAQGKMSRGAVSLKTLKDYLRGHPEEQAALTAANQRHIFFRTVAVGPIGSLGITLTAGRSIAADASVYPAGALMFLRVAPRATAASAAEKPVFSRFAVIQDAGSAISGASRADVFWGSGPTAEAIAGDLRNPGEMYLVLPK